MPAPQQRSNSATVNSPPPPFRPAHTNSRPSNVCIRYENLNGAQGQAIHSKWWLPKVTKDILVLGTSNLSKISWFSRRDAEVHSYPGLKLWQLVNLLKAFKHGHGSADPGLKPSKVVISVGLNDRGCTPEYNESTLKQMVNLALKKFKGSQIYLAQIPFGSHLPEREKRTLKCHNRAILEISKRHANVHVIPLLPARKFQLGRDGIHWTENCANAMIDHYFQHLN